MVKVKQYNDTLIDTQETDDEQVEISGKDIEPIIDPNLYDEANYQAYMKEQDRIAKEHEIRSQSAE